MGIGVHQLAILQGSEVAHVERALVRAPAAFLGFETHKEGHHFRSCKPGFARLFVSWLRPCHFTQFTAPDRSGSSRRNGLVWLSDHPVAPRTTVGSSRSAEPGSRPGHLADSNLDRVRTIVGSPRGTMPKPSSIYSATPNLTRTRTLLRRLTWVPPPRHRPEAIARRPKTKNRLELQLFRD